MRGDRERASRRAHRFLVGLLAAALLDSCASRSPGLGVPPTEATSLASFTITFARPDGIYVARGDGTGERRLVGTRELEAGETPFLASLDRSGSHLLFLSMSGRDPRSGQGSSLSLHVVEIRADRRASWRRVRLDRMLGGDAANPVEAAMIPGASWSADGARIALGLRRAGRGLEDALLLTDGQGAPQLLLELDGHRLFPGSGLTWLPSGDGVLVALEGGAGAASDTAAGVVAQVALDPAGRAARGVRELTTGRDPAVSPDGTRVAIVDAASSAGDIVLVDLEGKQLDRFERPAGRGLNHLFWSPDGRYLYYNSLASTGPLGIVEIGLLRCLDTRARRVFDLVRLG